MSNKSMDRENNNFIGVWYCFSLDLLCLFCVHVVCIVYSTCYSFVFKQILPPDSVCMRERKHCKIWEGGENFLLWWMKQIDSHNKKMKIMRIRQLWQKVWRKMPLASFSWGRIETWNMLNVIFFMMAWNWMMAWNYQFSFIIKNKIISLYRFMSNVFKCALSFCLNIFKHALSYLF
jgi:hypothetical protein